MKRNLAILISFLLHPLLMPTTGLIILLFSGSYYSDLPAESKKMLIMLFGTGTLLLPALMIPVVYMRLLVSDIQITNNRDRTLPIATTLIFFILTFFMLLRIPVYRIIQGFMLGSLLSVFFSLIISFRWKISIHMIGLGGLTSFILMISLLHHINLFLYLVLTILASGLIGTCRLYLRMHSPEQIYTGYFLGFILMCGSLWFFR